MARRSILSQLFRQSAGYVFKDDNIFDFLGKQVKKKCLVCRKFGVRPKVNRSFLNLCAVLAVF